MNLETSSDRREPGDELIDRGFMLCGVLCGDVHEVTEQTATYDEIGLDQVVFGLPFTMEHEDALNRIRLYGEHASPRFDTDPAHRTIRSREGGLA